MDEKNNSSSTIPTGLCQCGCGGRTKIVRHTNVAKGRIKGKYSRFIRGHNNRKAERYTLTDTGMETACMVWKLAKDRDGYGLAWDASGKMMGAHRQSYEAKFGLIPPDRQLDHLCRIRACVNPDHLDPVPAAENVRRGAATKLTAEDVVAIRASTEKQHLLALRYGISPSHVSSIKTRRAWRDIDPSDASPAVTSDGPS